VLDAGCGGEGVKQTYIMAHDTARQRAIEAVRTAQEGYVVNISPPTRTSDQNARLWASLNDVSKQVVWHGRKLDSESWKHIFSSSLKKMDVVPNLEGTGFVALGLSTSRMTKTELSDLLTLVYAFGSERDVQWSEPMQVAA
jgi:hypothetical protein